MPLRSTPCMVQPAWAGAAVVIAIAAIAAMVRVFNMAGLLCFGFGGGAISNNVLMVLERFRTGDAACELLARSSVYR